MLRLLPLSCRHRCTPLPARGLASSALLSRSWDSESSVAELRDGAKQRGLSTKGSKKVLASRIEEHDKSLSASNAAGARQASSLGLASAPSLITAKDQRPLHTTANMAGKRESSCSSSLSPSPTANPTKAPGNPEAPFVPATPYNFDIKIPNISYSAPLPLAQPPFVPDFWNSSSLSIPVEEDALPKVVVVAGAATHHGGGPTHSSMDLDENNVAALKPESSESFLDDIAEDLGLPPVVDKLKGLFSSFRLK